MDMPEGFARVEDKKGFTGISPEGVRFRMVRLENYPEHIYFEYKEIGYCINTKDYRGTILANMDSEVWDIGYGSGKYNRYGKKVPIVLSFSEGK